MLAPRCNRRAGLRALLALPLLLSLARPAAAQEPVATLTLDEAIALARRHNPDFQAAKNDEGEADWAVREAYGNLFPGAYASTGFQYQAKGKPRFGIFTAGDIGFGEGTPSYFLSDYWVGLDYEVGLGSFYRVSRERANRRAVVARTEATEFTLTVDVTRQYLSVLRAQDGIELAQQELERAAENAKLAQARVAVGAAISLESKQAEVEKGRAEVALLQAENALQTSKLRLVQALGIELDRDVALTSTFEVFEPSWTQDELIGYALQRHPQLRALHAAEAAGHAAMRAARSSYLPTLRLSAGFSGYTREAGNSQFLIDQARDQSDNQVAVCEGFNLIFERLTEPLPTQDCTRFAFTADQQAALIRDNDVFPFNFTRQPFTAQLQVTLPIFQGFTRQRQVESAKVVADDARQRLRAEELRLRADAASAHLNLETAHQTVLLEERNRSLGEEQLRLARERYRIGAAPFLELKDAETIKARADRAHLMAVYDFHEALAALEAAVGRKLARSAEEKP